MVENAEPVVLASGKLTAIIGLQLYEKSQTKGFKALQSFSKPHIASQLQVMERCCHSIP